MFAAKTYFDTCLRKVHFSVHMVTGHVIIATDHTSEIRAGRRKNIQATVNSSGWREVVVVVYCR